MSDQPSSRPSAPDQVGTCAGCGCDLRGMPPAAPCPECGRQLGVAVGVDGSIGVGLACVNCGYDLLGLDADGVCPECGTPCEFALRGNLLLYSGEGYMASLQRGVGLVTLATFLSGVLLVATIVDRSLIAWTGSGFGAPVGIALGVLGAVNAGVFVAGWWWLSAPDPGYRGLHTGADARAVARWSTIAIAGLLLLELGVDAMVWSGAGLGVPARTATLIVGLAQLIAVAVQFFASMLYLRWLAPRLPNRALYVRTRRDMWLLPVVNIGGAFCMMMGPLVATVMYWRLLDVLRTDLLRIEDERAEMLAARRRQGDIERPA